MAPTVFFIGLGSMGWGMSKNIIQKAELDGPLIVYNRTRERAAAFAAQIGDDARVAVADTIESGVARADIVWMMLSDDQVVESVFDEALQGAASLAAKLFIQSATIHPDTTARIAAKVEGRGAAFVTAPVFGPPAMADQGSLIVAAAGAGDAVDRARVLFRGVIAREEILLRGAPVAHAAVLKVIANTFIFNMVEQLAEGHVLAEKTGLGTAPLHQFITAMFPGAYGAYSERMLSGRYYTLDRPLTGVDLARKDAGYALGMAQAHGVPLPNTQTADAHLVKVKEHAGAAGDVAAIYGVVRQEAGLPFENQTQDGGER